METPWGKLSESNKSSNRAVVLDYPVRLASVDLDWRRNVIPAPTPALTDEQILTLSVAECRYRGHFQHHNGHEGRYFNTPRDKLIPERKSLDENIVNTMESLLASEGIEITQGVTD